VLPIGDDNTARRRTPYVVWGLVLVNVVVFSAQLAIGDRLTMGFAAIPYEITHGVDLTGIDLVRSGDEIVRLHHAPGPTPIQLTLLSSMFMHGGWLHLLGNMLYLWIFGDNLENALGHLRYLIFYLVTGVLASLAHVFTTVATHGNMLVPSLGASGAISGVLGGYILLFPGRRVRMLMGRGTAEMPAWVSIGMWFLFQVVAGMGLLGGGSQAGGVAYAAHVGGFIAGLILVKMFARGTAPTRRA
jgi:membrane associated rhomboid family serine protease